MSEYEIELTNETQQFVSAHTRAIQLLAHVVPLDVTMQTGMPARDGRVRIEATLATDKEPPALTEVTERYRSTPAGYAVDTWRSVVRLQGSDVVLVQDDLTEAPRASADSERVWTGPGEQEVAPGTASELLANGLYASIDAAYAADREVVMQQQEGYIVQL